MSEPTFDAKTLASLTQKIQTGLTSGTDARKGSKSRGGDRKPDSQLRSQQSDRSSRQTVQGKKRTRDGHEKPQGRYANGAPNRLNTKAPGLQSRKDSRRPDNRRPIVDRSARPDKRTQAAPEPSKYDLRQIVNELGGDDDDLKLIEDAGSDSELEGQGGELQAGLKQDLHRMVKELGLAQVRNEDAETSEEEEDHGAEDDVADEDTDKDVEGNATAGPPQTAADEARQGEHQDDDEDDDESRELIAKAKQALQSVPTKNLPNASGLLLEPQAEWHTIGLPAVSKLGAVSSDVPLQASAKLHEYAKQLLQEENDRYSKTNTSATSANKFYSTIMTSGTLSDKVSALTLSVQESPLHNVRTLENLVNLAKKRNRGQAVEVLGALKDLLGPGSLLPSDRRLRNFAAQPLLKLVTSKALESLNLPKYLPKPLTKAHLIAWAYEDWLKTTYFDILKILEVWCNDEIPYTRLKSVGYIFELLRDKPEQEANLLRLLVNKLGDTDKKIASKASYYILQVQNSHPAMKPLIISAMESDLIFKPHQSNHAKYYGIITLNQSVLSSKEETVARQLLDIYFAMFIILLKNPIEEPAKPSKPATKLNSKGEVQGGGSAPGKRAQKKVALESKSTAAADELRDKMLSAVLTGVNRAIPFVDKTSDFLEKHVDTLFRVTHSANFNTSVQALMLIQQLCGEHQAASERFYRTLYESLLDPRILTSSKQALYLNLLYRALRSDLSVKRIKAFVKRMLQTVAMHQPSFACAVIYLIRELEGIFPGLTALIDQAEADESDDEEAFRDVPEDGEEVISTRLSKSSNGRAVRSRKYDGKKRDPEHAAAEASCLWELTPLLSHYHPSVSIFAASLLNHGEMPSKPDLNANTLIHFLDRFVYRNPKKSAAGLKGQSIMQPLAAGDESGQIVTSHSKGSKPLNTESFRVKASGEVAPDEVFFHRYFNQIGKKTDKAKKKREDKRKQADDDEEADEAGGEDEDEIWQALVESRPEIEGEDEDEEGFDVEDLDDEMGDLEDETLEVASDDDGVPIQGDEDLAEMLGEDDDDESDGGFDFDDEDAILDSDDEVPADVATATSLMAADDGEGGGRKSNKRRKMFKSLPTFASADDYAKMLEDEEEED